MYELPKHFGVIIAVAVFLFIGVFFVFLPEEQNGIVIAKRLNFRSCPNIESEIIGTLKKNQTVRIKNEVEITEGWLKVSLNNKTGYVSEKYIRKVDSINSESSKRAVYILLGSIVIILVSFSFPLLLYPIFNPIFNMEPWASILLIIGIALLTMTGIYTNPYLITLFSVVFVIVIAIAALFLSWIIHEFLSDKLNDLLFKFRRLSKIMKIIGIVGLAYGIGSLIFELVSIEWRPLMVNNFINSMNNNDPNWTNNAFVRNGMLENFMVYFNALGYNTGRIIVSLIKNLFEPWATITTAFTFIRLK